MLHEKFREHYIEIMAHMNSLRQNDDLDSVRIKANDLLRWEKNYILYIIVAEQSSKIWFSSTWNYLVETRLLKNFFAKLIAIFDDFSKYYHSTNGLHFGKKWIRNSVYSGYQIYHYYNHCTIMITCYYDTVRFILSPNFTEKLFKQK